MAEWTLLRRSKPRPLVLSYVASQGARPRIEAELARPGYEKGTHYLIWVDLGTHGRPRTDLVSKRAVMDQDGRGVSPPSADR